MNWLQQLISRRREYHNVSEEIAEHLQEKVEELTAGGMSRPEAEATARAQAEAATQAQALAQGACSACNARHSPNSGNSGNSSNPGDSGDASDYGFS